MSHLGNAVSPDEIAISAQSAADSAANRIQSPAPDDPRLLWLIDAWPGLLEVTQVEILKLAGFYPDDDDPMAKLTRKAVSR